MSPFFSRFNLFKFSKQDAIEEVNPEQEDGIFLICKISLDKATLAKFQQFVITVLSFLAVTGIFLEVGNMKFLLFPGQNNSIPSEILNFKK